MNPPAEHTQRVRIRLKAVPGASRDSIAGVLGDRLKVRTSAAPEGGKANKAICALLAKALDLKKSDVVIVSGHTNPEKTAEIIGPTPQALGEKLGINADAVLA